MARYISIARKTSLSALDWRKKSRSFSRRRRMRASRRRNLRRKRASRKRRSRTKKPKKARSREWLLNSPEWLPEVHDEAPNFTPWFNRGKCRFLAPKACARNDNRFCSIGHTDAGFCSALGGTERAGSGFRRLRDQRREDFHHGGRAD